MLRLKIKKFRKSAGLTQAALVTKAGISQPYLSQLENGSGGRMPSMETLISIAAVLGCAVKDLLYDDKPIPILGRVGVGAEADFAAFNDNPEEFYSIACPDTLSQQRDKIAAVEVMGNGMPPIYKQGDVLFYKRKPAGVLPEAIGSICICCDEDDNVWLKVLQIGEKDTYNLIGVNQFSIGLQNVRLKWATPIILHLPKELVERD